MSARSSVVVVAALMASTVIPFGTAHAADDWESSPVYAKWQALGGAAFAGDKVGDEVVEGGKRWAKFSKYDVVITWDQSAGAHWFSGAISRRWLDGSSRLVASTDQVPVNRGAQAGAAVDFGRSSSIYYSDAYGAFMVNGSERDTFLGNGGVTGRFGWPTSDLMEITVAGSRRWEQQFSEAVSTYREPERGATWISGALRDKLREGWAAGGWDFPAGWQLPAAGNGWQIRTHLGEIYWSAATGAHKIDTSASLAYQAEGGPGGRFGYPSTDTREHAGGFITDFVNRTTLYHGPADFNSFWISDRVRDEYGRQGGPSGPLGWPRSSQTPAPGTDGQYVLFGDARDKVILWGPRTGGHVVQGAILTKLRNDGDVAVYGLPQYGQLPAGTAQFQQFENATVFLRADDHVPTLGWDFRDFWWQLGGMGSPLGIPRGDVHPLGSDKFLVQDFDNGLMWCDYEIGECSYSIKNGTAQATPKQSADGPKFRMTRSGPRR